MQRLYWYCGQLLALALLLGLTLTLMPLPRSIYAQQAERCFDETGYCIAGRMRQFWEQNGGLPVFGLPITSQRMEMIEGQAIAVQWFERNRLELHPGNPAPYDVLLGRLGVDVLEQQGLSWFTFPRDAEPQPGCRFFPETGQNVCGAILNTWRSSGLEFDGQPGISDAESLALFGLPISPLQTEPIEGRALQVQWFERARFELHPDNPPPYDVLLGLLGNRLVTAGDLADTPPTARITWPTVQVNPLVGGLTNPTYVTHAGDGSGRLFVVEQPGTIRIWQEGALLPAPFLDIRDRVLTGSERGLLSIAFPPDYSNKGYFYLNYTDRQGNTVVSRFFVTEEATLADPNSEQIVLTVDQPYANHNGGQLAFGPDNYLYIGMGDGGSAGDPENYAQNVSSLLGKLLRIDVESGVAPYAIPPDNPFVAVNEARPEIWAYGLRNPWRFSFDAQTGDLYIADVGQNRAEEINVQPAISRGGENYGWNVLEGWQCFGTANCDTSGLTMPVWEYEHRRGNCSVTGGYVYRGQQFAAMQGIYYFGDYCSGIIWGMQPEGADWSVRELYQAPFTISSFGEDEAGNLYVVNYIDGSIYTLTLAE